MLRSMFVFVLSFLLIFCLLISFFISVSVLSASVFAGPCYKIWVKEGDWVEYVVTKVIEKAIIPIEFKDSFPKNWTSLNEGSLIRVDVLEKTNVNFDNYAREFAIFNVTFNDNLLLPFWFYETIQSVERLPFDGFSFFLPTNESYWNCLKNQVEYLAGEVSTYGFQVTYDVRKCFYRLRVDGLMFGWIEVSANYDDYFGVLSDFGLTFSFSPDFVNEIQRRVGTIVVDGEPFQIESGKKYGVEISLSDSNIPQLINKIEYGQNFAEALNQAIENEKVGAIITIKSALEKGTISRVDVMAEQLNPSVNATADRIIINIDSNAANGKVIIVNIQKDVFPVQWVDEFRVLLNNEPISTASDYGDVLDPFDDKGAEYYVIIGSKSTQVVISMPTFSAYTIEIIKVPSLTAKLILFSTIAGVGCLAILGVYILRRRIKYRKEQ